MRAVDADELKKGIVELCGNINANKGITIPTLAFIRLIDNADTVELEKILVANVTFDKDELNRLIDERVIEPIKNGELVIKEERSPQGKWIKSGKTTFFCSECGREINTKPFTRPDNFPFCHCGAEMKGVTE